MSQADPFHFYTRLHLRELTGLKAKNLTELAAHLETVPGSVVYHHTHHFLQQHQYLSPEPPNDFAYWVTEILQDKKLGERLTSINTCDFKTIRELREKIVSTIKAYLEKSKDLREAPEGEEFHFIKSVSFIFPTPFLASNLQEFTAVLKKIGIDWMTQEPPPQELLDNTALIREAYAGIRPAPGYPACPDHTEKALLWDLIDANKNAGIVITENFAMVPTAAVSGWYFSHPESRYFGVGKINQDQVEDYARRKGLERNVMERWLSPNLGYEPD